MPHRTPLISTIVVALVLAFLGAVASRLRVLPLDLAEIGIIPLLSVKAIAIPEAGQVVGRPKAINRELRIVARSRSDEETGHLMQPGASRSSWARTRSPGRCWTA